MVENSFSKQYPYGTDDASGCDATAADVHPSYPLDLALSSSSWYASCPTFHKPHCARGFEASESGKLNPADTAEK